MFLLLLQFIRLPLFLLLLLLLFLESIISKLQCPWHPSHVVTTGMKAKHVLKHDVLRTFGSPKFLRSVTGFSGFTKSTNQVDFEFCPSPHSRAAHYISNACTYHTALLNLLRLNPQCRPRNIECFLRCTTPLNRQCLQPT